MTIYGVMGVLGHEKKYVFTPFISPEERPYSDKFDIELPEGYTEVDTKSGEKCIKHDGTLYSVNEIIKADGNNDPVIMMNGNGRQTKFIKVKFTKA